MLLLTLEALKAHQPIPGECNRMDLRRSDLLFEYW